MCGRWGSGRARHGQSGSGHPQRRPSGRLWPASLRSPDPQYSPATLIPDLSHRARDNAGPLGSRGCGRQSVRCAAELRARRRRRCSARPCSGPFAVCQWELSGCLRLRPRGRGSGSPWETEHRLGGLTIAPPPAGQSETAGTGAGRSELGSAVTTGARWVPGLYPSHRRATGEMLAPRARGLPSHEVPAARPRESRGRQPWRGGLSNGEESPNKAALGGPSGLRLLPQ